MFSYISKLKLTNYRNFERLNLELPDSSISLVGRNGVGKTNIIEAMYMDSTNNKQWNAGYTNLDNAITNLNNK